VERVVVSVLLLLPSVLMMASVAWRLRNAALLRYLFATFAVCLLGLGMTYMATIGGAVLGGTVAWLHSDTQALMVAAAWASLLMLCATAFLAVWRLAAGGR